MFSKKILISAASVKENTNVLGGFGGLGGMRGDPALADVDCGDDGVPHEWSRRPYSGARGGADQRERGQERRRERGRDGERGGERGREGQRRRERGRGVEEYTAELQ